METIRLVLCDDQPIVTEGLQMILSGAPRCEVIGVAQDGAEAVDIVAREQPDLVLMDLRMPILNGIQATRQICERFPETKVLVLTTYDDDGWVFDAIRAGASGYLLKDTPREQLIAAIRGTVAGTTHVDPQVAGKLFQQISRPGAIATSDANLLSELNERELEILQHVAQGLDNFDIAARLHLSKGTVQNYVSSILAKLDVTNRTQAAIIALRHGLVN